MHPREVAIVAALVLGVLVPWLAVRDVLRQSRPALAAAGVPRLGMVLLVVLVPLLGPALWLRHWRPRVRAHGPVPPRPRA